MRYHEEGYFHRCDPHVVPAYANAARQTGDRLEVVTIPGERNAYRDPFTGEVLADVIITPADRRDLSQFWKLVDQDLVVIERRRIRDERDKVVVRALAGALETWVRAQVPEEILNNKKTKFIVTIHL